MFISGIWVFPRLSGTPKTYTSLSTPSVSHAFLEAHDSPVARARKTVRSQQYIHSSLLSLNCINNDDINNIIWLSCSFSLILIPMVPTTYIYTAGTSMAITLEHALILKSKLNIESSIPGASTLNKMHRRQGN